MGLRRCVLSLGTSVGFRCWTAGCWAAAVPEAPAALSGREAKAELAQARGRGVSWWEAKAPNIYIICIAQTLSGFLCLSVHIFGLEIFSVCCVGIHFSMLNFWTLHRWMYIFQESHFWLFLFVGRARFVDARCSRMSFFIYCWHNIFKVLFATPDQDSGRFSRFWKGGSSW